MSNNISPSQIIHYISEEKCILVGRNNQPNQQLLKFDYKLNSTFKFQIINKINQIITPDADEYELFGSFVDSKQNLHILFYTKIQASDITNNILSFDVDSYTSEYLNNVKNQRQIDVSIVAIKNNVAKSMILRDIGLAFPRPYVTGRTPIEIVSHNVFMNLNSPVTGSLNVGSEFTDIAVDINTFSFGEGLYTDTENQVVIGTYNVPSATTHKAFVIGNGSSDSQRSNSFSIDLSGNVEANSIIINGSSVATAADLTGFATESYVDAAVSGKADLSSVYTKEEVYTYLETDARINAATSGKADLSALTDYATEQWVEDKGYITGYTAGSGIQINNNVISLTGQLGETYTADNDTLKLVNNQFSIKSVFPMIKSAGGVTITKDSEGITYLKVTTSGGGGGSSTEYFAGTGLELGSDPELPETTFSINTTWLAAQIFAATSGLENYSAGTGISIDEQNVISVTGMVTTDQIANMATTGWVTGYCSSFITKDALSDYAKTSAVTAVDAKFVNYYTSAQVDTAITSATSGKADKDDLNDYTKTTDLNDYLSTGILTGYVTDQQLETTSSNIINTLSSVSGTLNSALTSNVETLSTAIDTKTTAQQVTGLITGYVAQNLSAVSQLVNDTGFITLASLDDYAQLSDIPVVTDFVTTDELSATSAAVVQLIPDTSDLATEEDLQAVSAVVSAKADKSYVDQTFLSAIPDEYVTATELATELQPYALSANVDTSIAAATGIVTSWVDGKGYLTAHQDLTNYATNDNVTAASANAVNVATGWVADQNYLTAHQSLDAYATQQWVEDKGYITGIANNALLSDVTSAINDLSAVISTNYLTGVDLTSYAQTSTVNGQFEATSSWVTDTVSANLQTAINNLPPPTAYTAGTGLELNGTEFSLTAQIPTDEDISGIASAVTTGYLENYDTSSEVDDKITAAIAQIDFPEGVNYTAGEGLGLSSTQNGKEFYLTAHIPTTVAELTDASNYALKSTLDTVSGDLDTAETAIGTISGKVDTLAAASGNWLVENDLADYAKKTDIPTATVNTLTGNVEFLSGAIDYVSGVVNDIDIPDVSNFIDASSASTIASGVVDSYITSGLASRTDITTAISDLSGVISTDYLKKVDETKYTDADVATYLTTNNYVTSSVVSTALSATSAAIKADIPIVSTYVAGTNVTITPVENENKFTVSATDTTYTAGTGLELDNNTNTFSVSASWLTGQVTGVVDVNYLTGLNVALTSDIPTDLGDLTNNAGYIKAVSTEDKEAISGAAVTSAKNYVDTELANYTKTADLNIPTSTSQLTNDSQFATSAYVDEVSANIVTGQITGLASRVTTLENADYQTSSDVSNIITTDVDSSYVSNLGFVTTDTTYTAGTGIEIDENDNNKISVKLSAATNGNIEVTTNNGVIYLSAATGGGGDGKYYVASTGIIVDNSTTTGTISIDQNWLENNFAPVITNKRKIVVDSEVKSSTYKLTYAADTDVFVNTIETDNGVLTLTQVSGFTGDNGQVATFEHWIKPDGTLTSVVGDGVEIVNLPNTFDATKTQVFTRRIVKVNNIVSQYAVWEYAFNNAAIPEDDKIIATSPQDFTFELSSNVTSALAYSTVGTPSNIGFTLGSDLPAGISFSNGSFSNTGSQMAGNGTYTMAVTISATNSQSETITKTVLANLTLTGFELVEIPNQEFGFTYNTNATSSVAFTYHGNQSATTGVVLTGSYSLPNGISFNNGIFTCTGANLTGNTTTPLTAVISAADADSITTEFDLEVSGVPIIASNQSYNFDMRQADQQSGQLIYTHLGSAAVNVAFSPTLDGITYNNGVFSGVNGITNGTHVYSTTISADDADSATINTTFNVVGVVTETISAQASSFTMDFASVDEVSSDYNFTYSGSNALTVEVSGLPVGISWTSGFNSSTHIGTITFVGLKSVGVNDTFNVTVKIYAIDTAYQTTSVSITTENAVIDYSTTPVTFKSTGDTTIKFKKNGNSTGGNPTISLQYSKNGGDWTNYSLDQQISLTNGQTVAFSGQINQYGYGNIFGSFLGSGTGTLEVYGNILSLNNWSDTYDSTNRPGYYLFERCDRLKDASNLLLPAMDLTERCYQSMFRSCADLTDAPALPATGLAGNCYNGMFMGCSILSSPIYLPATTLANDCYSSMFSDCSGLTTFEVNFTSWGTNNQQYTWFWFSSLANTTGKTFIKPSTLPYVSGISNIPSGWIVQNK